MSPPAVPSDDSAAFERLKPRLRKLWQEVFGRDDQSYTSIVVPSLSLPSEELALHPGCLFLEETLLFFLIRLRNPRARLIYLTSQPLHPMITEYYLQFLAGIPASHARARLTLLAAYDASPRPLAQKILERPRLLRRIRAAIPDREHAYLTVFNATPLERQLAVALDVPLNAPDPDLEQGWTRTSSRELLRELGLTLPAGSPPVRQRGEVVEALGRLKRERPGLAGALLKLDRAYWGEGLAVVRLPPSDAPAALDHALDALTPASPRETPGSYLARFERVGGVVEELVEGGERHAASVQVRVTPLGQVRLTSTHEEIRGGMHGLVAGGCRFPAREAHRLGLQEAGMAIGARLAERGFVGRLSAEFLLRRATADASWELVATDVHLGATGTTHPLMAVRFLSEGQLDPGTGLFVSPSGRPKFYRAADVIECPAYRGLLPEDLVEILTLQGLHYSPRTESGALFHMLGALSEFGRVGLVTIGNSREEADVLFGRTVAALDQETGGTVRASLDRAFGPT